MGLLNGETFTSFNLAQEPLTIICFCFQGNNAYVSVPDLSCDNTWFWGSVIGGRSLNGSFEWGSLFIFMPITPCSPPTCSRTGDRGRQSDLQQYICSSPLLAPAGQIWECPGLTRESVHSGTGPAVCWMCPAKHACFSMLQHMTPDGCAHFEDLFWRIPPWYVDLLIYHEMDVY